MGAIHSAVPRSSLRVSDARSSWRNRDRWSRQPVRSACPHGTEPFRSSARTRCNRFHREQEDRPSLNRTPSEHASAVIDFRERGPNCGLRLQSNRRPQILNERNHERKHGADYLCNVIRKSRLVSVFFMRSTRSSTASEAFISLRTFRSSQASSSSAGSSRSSSRRVLLRLMSSAG